MKVFKTIFGIVLIIIFLVGIGFVVWASAAAPATPAALAAGQSNAKVIVTVQNGWQVFIPAQGKPTTGLIFYPGGRVDYLAYAPILRPLAEKGYLVVVPAMPLNLAFFAANKAAEVMPAFPEIKRWAIGGHSLGGAMAANFSINHPDQIQGLVLWAAYPAASDNLSAQKIKVVSIFATQDGLATADKINASRPLLPTSTRWVTIEGGNHAQFGSYGPQSGDGQATVLPETQWNQVAAATEALLKELEK